MARWGRLVNASDGSVSLIGDHGPKGKLVKLGGPLSDAAPGPDGSIIVLTRDGVVVRVGTDASTHRMPILRTAAGLGVDDVVGVARLALCVDRDR